MRHAVTLELFAYWDALRGDRTAPEREEIDPAAIRRVLPYTFILEVASIAGGSRDVTVRLSGTRLNALFQADLKGRDFTGLWASSHAEFVRVMIDDVLDGRSAVVAGAVAAPREGRAIDLELLLTPLRHHGKTHTRILGSLAAASVPSWLGLAPTEPLALTSFRTMGSRRDGDARFSVAARTGSTPRPAASLEAAAPTPPSRRSLSAPSEVSAPISWVGPFRVYQGGRADRAAARNDL